MKSLDSTCHATLAAALASIGTAAQIKALGLSGGYVASGRTIGFDIPAHPPKASEPTKTVNRVKLVAEGEDGVAIRLLEVLPSPLRAIGIEHLDEVTQHHESESVPADKVGATLADLIGLGK